MMKMQTQFGEMVITDENQTIVSEELKKEIEDNCTDDKKPNLVINDKQNLDK